MTNYAINNIFQVMFAIEMLIFSKNSNCFEIDLGMYGMNVLISSEICVINNSFCLQCIMNELKRIPVL